MDGTDEQVPVLVSRRIQGVCRLSLLNLIQSDSCYLTIIQYTKPNISTLATYLTRRLSFLAILDRLCEVLRCIGLLVA